MKAQTDWNEYYAKPFKASYITRQITTKIIIKTINQLMALDKEWRPLKIIEMGGANSCFYNRIKDQYLPEEYLVIDNNSKGLSMLKDRVGDDGVLHICNEDVLESTGSQYPADLVYSVGLIEHFKKEDTAKVIGAHFSKLRKGGYCIITFPTPSLLYRGTRKIAELMGVWAFWDERPLEFSEVLSVVSKYGEITRTFINRWVVLAQGFVVVRKQ